MRRRKRETSVRSVHVRVGGLAALVAALGIAGCVGIPRAPADRPAEGLQTANLGASSAAVFASPEVAEAYEGVQIAALPEHRRNNRHLSDRPREPLTALDDWPQRRVPDVTRRRSTTIIRGDNTFLFFLPDHQRGGSGGFGY